MLSAVDGVAPPPNPPPNPPSVAYGSKAEMVEATASVKDVGSKEEDSQVVVVVREVECVFDVVEESVVDVAVAFTDSAKNIELAALE